MKKFLVSAMVGLMSISMVACEDSEIGKQDVKEVAKQVENTQNKKPKSLDENIKDIIIESVGEKTNREVDKIREISINDNLGTEVEGDKIVLVHLNANDNVSSKMIKGKILMDSTEVFKNISKLNEVSELTLFNHFPLLDQYGNENDQVILKVGLKKETTKKINWDNFNRDNFKDIADQYYEHPALNK